MIKDTDRKEILNIIKKSTSAREIYRANTLNLRSKGLTAAEVGDFLEITPRTVFNIQKNYEEGGLKKALHDDPRPGQPIQFDDRVKTQIVAMVCSDPPEGFDRWTLELIHKEVKNRKYLKDISVESIRLILKEHDLKPWQQRSWCVPELDEAFIENMEDVLKVYEGKPDPKKPLICLDEKPIQLLEDVRPASGMDCGSSRKVDYEYKRKGTCNVFCAVEPHTGTYYNRVTERRTSRDFAKFIGCLERKYPDAKKIILVMDNLNTHKKKSLTDFYGEEEGSRIWNRFEVHYTPKHGSWLNQAEIAINVYSRQCLGKSRIPDIKTLRKKTKAWNAYANRKKVKIIWKFTRAHAQEKFNYTHL